MASVLLLATTPAMAQQSAAPVAAPPAEQADSKGRWVTLGTRAGPLASAVRSQPANLLTFAGAQILVDVGDGTAGRLAAVGVPVARLDAVFISHLHWDHTGGLAALLGLRAQTNTFAPLRIYGPPGTAEMVAGLLASMNPGATAGYGVAGAKGPDLKTLTEVIEVRDKARIDYRGIAITARNNTHYSFAPGSGLAERFESLAFRFDLPGRSIVYTGDTGPSAAVEELAQGADLLIAEMMDVTDTVANVRRANPNMPEPARLAMEAHLREHHLLPADVGQMATRAKVRGVVVTHFIGRERGDPAHFEYLRQIVAHYTGPVVIANDLDAF
ncbi:MULTISPECIES: MBL fold metallo-hydrolase [unclassified Novosphingobium]|uniref:MBL fold metallo-hydrolase n=1 Tax=unclassified Novosphingobium TaxID=2644732 RepID=UPI0025D1F622|nr:MULTISPECIES: MBL fold metallo-hydrolase [unclassified Novosphingobium]HQS68079.1 MBL fold metallo-hydrolase [Novosphingobium sp.]